MSHSFKFCILGAHINNAESQLALLQSIEKFKVDNYNYDLHDIIILFLLIFVFDKIRNIILLLQNGKEKKLCKV